MMMHEPVNVKITKLSNATMNGSLVLNFLNLNILK